MKVYSTDGVLLLETAGANLREADLRGADLRGADLEGTNLRGAEGVIAGGWPNSWYCYGWLREGFLSIRVGCREKRLHEALEYWDRPEKDNRREVVAAVRYIEAVALIRGWKIG